MRITVIAMTTKSSSNVNAFRNVGFRSITATPRMLTVKVLASRRRSEPCGPEVFEHDVLANVRFKRTLGLLSGGFFMPVGYSSSSSPFRLPLCSVCPYNGKLAPARGSFMFVHEEPAPGICSTICGTAAAHRHRHVCCWFGEYLWLLPRRSHPLLTSSAP